MPHHIKTLEVRRDDLRMTRVVSDPLPEVGAGEVLLAVDRFGLTTNNITYGVAGDMIGYWGFFPSTDGWGRIPVWGFADVVASDIEDLPEGTRVFGYLPMSTHLVVAPSRVSPHGFTDGAAHRSQLPALYNRYQRTDADPMYLPETEDLQAILFPLFATSFVIDDFLADNDDFGADRIVLTSASSKTAAGTALCISQREGHRPQVVGLTSARHVDLVAGLGWYDQVVGYDDIATLDPSLLSVLVDIAGNAEVRLAVHQLSGDRLTASHTVGMTHWEARPTSAPLPGPTPAMFFAPTQVDKRIAEWGVAGYQERFGAAWSRAVAVAPQWLDIVDVAGFDALQATYRRLLEGAASPAEGFIVHVG